MCPSPDNKVLIDASNESHSSTLLTPAPKGTRFDASRLWWRSRAAQVPCWQRLVTAGLVGLGTSGVFAFAHFWFRPEHIGAMVPFLLLTTAVWFGISRIVLGWIALLSVRQPDPTPPSRQYRVAVYTTAAPGEPLDMFERTLSALADLRYPHVTYLLDGTGDLRFRALASRYGARWIDSAGLEGAKAGKINHALVQTSEDIILVLDADHVPFPEFFERVLGFFDDPTVGFVQVSQAYYNQPRSTVARGAAEQTYGYYGPIQQGLNGLGCAVAIGANCTFRRSALESIGGHGRGLAEDLITSIRIHAAGWKSVYVPEVLSRGLVPEDLGGFLRQQLKWSAGAVDVVFSELPKAFRRLSWGQRLTYAAIGTYYLTGPSTAIYVVLPFLALTFGWQPVHVSLGQFVVTGSPILLASIGLFVVGQRLLCDPSTERGFPWHGALLKFATWPVYFAGCTRAVCDCLVQFVPTRKTNRSESLLRFSWPHWCVLCSGSATICATLLRRWYQIAQGKLPTSEENPWLLIAFLLVTVALSAASVRWGIARTTQPLPGPWTEIPPLETRPLEP